MNANVDLEPRVADAVRADVLLGRRGRISVDRTLVTRVVPAVLVVSGALLLVPLRDVRATVTFPLAFGQLDPYTAVLDLSTGLLLLMAGVAAWLAGQAWRIGLLAVLAGVAWFGPDLFALREADPLFRLVSHFVLSPLLWPLLLHLGAAHLGLDARGDVRLLLVGLYAATASVAIAAAASYEAFWDPWCIDCQWDNPLVAGTGASASGRDIPALLRVGWVVLALAVGAAASWLVARGWVTLGNRTRRRSVTLVTIASMGFVGCAAVLRGLLLLMAPVQDPQNPGWLLDWSLVAIGALAMAAAVIAAAISTWQRRERIGRLADSLVAAPEPGALAHDLALALDDPVLTIDYVTADGRLVDPGRKMVPGSGEPGLVTTPIERDGTVLAHVHHSAATDRAALAAAFGPTLLVALDNERLLAAQLIQLLELRRSRARIVAVADATRRRLERDLHDGVQQQLISVLFDLKSLRLAFDRHGDLEGAVKVTALEMRSQTAIDELRRIAHGIHPAILSRSGLEAALVSLADESPTPIEIRADGLGRLPDAVEAAAYAVASDMAGDVASRGAGTLAITAHLDGGSLHLDMRDDEGADAPPPQRLIDRVEASGGTVAVETTAEGGRALHVDLPCE